MEKLRLGLEWFLNPHHLPFLVALEKGWFEAVGIDARLVEPEQRLDLGDDVATGRLEVAISRPHQLVRDRARGKEIVGFARFLHTNGGVLFLTGAGVERPRDMAGRRIQYPDAPGPGGPAIVATMVEADGGACDPADFTPVNNGYRHVDALLEDKADLATPVFLNIEVVEAHVRGLRAGCFALKDWGVPDFCQLILVTSEELLFERRGLLLRLVQVLRRGIDFVHERPRESRELYDRRTGAYSSSEIGARIFEATLPCFTHDLSMSHDYFARLGEWLNATGQGARGLDRFAYWTNEIAL